MLVRSVLPEESSSCLVLITSTGTGVSVLALPAPRVPTNTISVNSELPGSRFIDISLCPDTARSWDLYPIMLISRISDSCTVNLKTPSLLVTVPDLEDLTRTVAPGTGRFDLESRMIPVKTFCACRRNELNRIAVNKSAFLILHSFGTHVI